VHERLGGRRLSSLHGGLRDGELVAEGALGEAHEAPQPHLRQVLVALRAGRSVGRGERFRAGGARLELARVTRSLAGRGQLRDAGPRLLDLTANAGAPRGEHRVGVGEANVAHEVERHLDEAPRGAFDVGLRRGDAVGLLDERRDRIRRGQLGLTRSYREQEGERRVGQRAGLGQIGAREAEPRQLDLEARAVPERRGHGVVGRERAQARDTGRHAGRGQLVLAGRVAGRVGDGLVEPRAVVGRAGASGREGRQGKEHGASTHADEHRSAT
jgi:hypothetical protein